MKELNIGDARSRWRKKPWFCWKFGGKFVEKSERFVGLIKLGDADDYLI